MHFQSTSLILYGWEVLQWLDVVQNFIPYGPGTRFCQLLFAHLSLLLICLARSVVVVISLCLLFLELLYHPCTARIALPADQSLNHTFSIIIPKLLSLSQLSQLLLHSNHMPCEWVSPDPPHFFVAKMTPPPAVQFICSGWVFPPWTVSKKLLTENYLQMCYQLSAVLLTQLLQSQALLELQIAAQSSPCTLRSPLPCNTFLLASIGNSRWPIRKPACLWASDRLSLCNTTLLIKHWQISLMKCWNLQGMRAWSHRMNLLKGPELQKDCVNIKNNI